MISPEFISCNIDTSRVTTKQYYEIILFYMLLLNETDILREFLPNTSLFSQKMYQAILLSLSDVNLFWIFVDWDKCKYYL